jgi:hypothetical protein
MTMKKKYQFTCPLCAGTQTRTLSDEAAVQILAFLEVIIENFTDRYGRRIDRYYAKRAQRNINVHEPWKGDCTDELF